uniref:hypothetical protein n=1 Tax=Streptomyces clavuligerus TaxID=1901 RepID=UPI001E56DD05
MAAVGSAGLASAVSAVAAASAVSWSSSVRSRVRVGGAAGLFVGEAAGEGSRGRPGGPGHPQA